MKIIRLSNNVKIVASEFFVAFDVETTGLSPTDDAIVEIGAAVFINGSVDKTFRTYVNPGCHIPENVSAINHITDEMVQDAPPIKEAIKAFYKFLEQYIEEDTVEILFASHNAKFDMGFLAAAKRKTRVKEPVEIYFVDTLAIAREKISLRNYKLGTIADAFEIEHDDHHAESDSVTCGKILLQLLPDRPLTIHDKARIEEENKKSMKRGRWLLLGMLLIFILLLIKGLLAR